MMVSISSTGKDYERPERFDWLLDMLDKHFVRTDQAFDSLNKKATWTLSTATALAASAGFVKGTSIGETARKLADLIESSPTISELTSHGIDIAIGVVVVLFTIAYLRLLYFVIQVYKPKQFEYPISPVNDQLGAVTSWRDDKGKFGELCWNDLVDRYIQPDDFECYHKVLRGYVDSQIVSYLTIDQMGKRLDQAFTCLYPVAVLSIILLLIA
jgi:hypothetical protein